MEDHAGYVQCDSLCSGGARESSGGGVTAATGCTTLIGAQFDTHTNKKIPYRRLELGETAMIRANLHPPRSLWWPKGK
jgi:hypothetical protein